MLCFRTFRCGAGACVSLVCSFGRRAVGGADARGQHFVFGSLRFVTTLAGSAARTGERPADVVRASLFSALCLERFASSAFRGLLLPVPKRAGAWCPLRYRVAPVVFSRGLSTLLSLHVPSGVWSRETQPGASFAAVRSMSVAQVRARDTSRRPRAPPVTGPADFIGRQPAINDPGLRRACREAGRCGDCDSSRRERGRARQSRDH